MARIRVLSNVQLSLALLIIQGSTVLASSSTISTKNGGFDSIAVTNRQQIPPPPPPRIPKVVVDTDDTLKSKTTEPIGISRPPTQINDNHNDTHNQGDLISQSSQITPPPPRPIVNQQNTKEGASNRSVQYPSKQIPLQPPPKPEFVRESYDNKSKLPPIPNSTDFNRSNLQRPPPSPKVPDLNPQRTYPIGRSSDSVNLSTRYDSMKPNLIDAEKINFESYEKLPIGKNVQHPERVDSYAQSQIQTNVQYDNTNINSRQFHSTPQRESQSSSTQLNHYDDRRPPLAVPRYGSDTRIGSSLRAIPPNQNTVVTRQSTTKQSTWNSIWGKVEKSLDGLAYLEDVVTNRVQKTLSTTASAIIEKVPESVTKLPIKVFSKDQIRNDRDHFETRGRISSQAMTSRPIPLNQKIPLNVNRPIKDVSPDPSNGIPFRKRAEPDQQQQRQQFQPKSSTTNVRQPGNTPRKIDWNSVMSGEQAPRLIHATGGASAPSSNYQAAQGSSRSVSNDTPAPAAASDNIDNRSNPYLNFPAKSLQSNTGQNKNDGGSRKFWQDARLAAQQTTSNTQQGPFPKDEDDDDGTSPLQKLGSLLPGIPNLSFLNPIRRSSSSSENVALDAWRVDDEKSQPNSGGILSKRFRRKQGAKRTKSKENTNLVTVPMANLVERCKDEGKPVSLLTSNERHQCTKIGQRKAILDIFALVCAVAATRSLPQLIQFPVPRTLDEAISNTLPFILSTLADAMESWFPYFVAATVLAVKSRHLISVGKERLLIKTVEKDVKMETLYGMLFLRLSTSATTERSIPTLMQIASKKQIASKIDVARSQYFIGVMLVALVTMSASILGPLSGVLLVSIEQIFSSEPWKTLPFNFGGIIEASKPILEEIKYIISEEFSAILKAPFRYAFEASVFVALLIAYFLPKLEQSRKTFAPTKVENDDEDDDDEMQHQKMTEQIWGMGSSGSNRIGLLSVNGRIESLLERWRTVIPNDDSSGIRSSWRSLVRFAGYSIISFTVLLGPIFVYFSIGMTSINKFSTGLLRWDRLFDVAVILMYTFGLVNNALSSTVSANDGKERVSSFVSTLVKSVEERKIFLLSSPHDPRFQATISANTGLIINDLWAAHSSKRAWAVRGANIQCKNGEVLVILGDEGSGRTRLLTTIAEALISPPRLSVTTQRVRGTVLLNGVDVSKWDRSLLQRRIGISLNDVRSQSDLAQTLSGLSLEEILDPFEGLNHMDQSHSPGTNERACMTLALKITGLYSTLLLRFPSKMSTIVTASEEDMGQLLSPGEWSKLILSRTLAQALFDNDNALGTTDTVVNSLIGSLLLLDDATLYLSEVEEARLIKDLRQSGAATIITSNRWATGRFADRIVVMKDGAIVESGTHSDLLQKGPQQSIYAAKWFTMTSY